MASDSTLTLLNCVSAVAWLVVAVLSLPTAARQFAEFLARKEKILVF